MRATLLALVIGLLLGAALTAMLMSRLHEQAVQDWEAARAAYLDQAQLADQQAAELRAMIDAETHVRLVLTQQSVARRDTIATLRRRLKAPVPALPDTGAIPVVRVRAIVDGMTEQIALRDSVIELQAQQLADDSLAIGSWQRQYTAMASVAVVHQVKRADCEALLKQAPVRAPTKKLLGFLPMPRISGGVQVGVDPLQHRAYTGLGVQLGWSL